MKKLWILLLAAGLIFAMVACGGAGQSAPAQPAQPPSVAGEAAPQEEAVEEEAPEAIPGEGGSLQPSIVRIDHATDEILGGFDALHGFDCGLEYGLDIVFWAQVPMRDFSVLEVSLDFVGDEMLVVSHEAWAVVDEVLPGQAAQVRYQGGGSLPTRGLSFVDEAGQVRYFTFIQNMGYPHDPGPYEWLIREFDAETGRLGALSVS